MGRAHTPCCSYVGLSRGPWTPEEDLRLIKYIEAHGEGNWRTLPRKAGLQRCGKGCRLRWMNYLRPNVKRGHISPDEEEMIVRLHKLLGNRWSLIAGRIPGRTDNEVKNYWNTHLRKKVNATKGLLRNSQSLCKQPSSLVEICDGGTGTLNINEMESSFAPCKAARDITRHAAKDQNKGSSCSHIGEIVSLLGGLEEFYDRSTYVARDAESIENWKQLIVGFHDPAINMDLSYSTVNHIDSASPHGNHHQSSSMPSIYSPEFKPMASPSDYRIPGLYHSISESVTSMQGHEFRLQVDNFGSGNYMNSKEKPTGDGSNNLQSKTTVEPEIHIPPLGFSTDHEFPIDCDGFHDFRDMVLPDFELEQNGILSSCMQPEDGITGLCSEPWLSSLAGWFDCIEQL